MSTRVPSPLFALLCISLTLFPFAATVTAEPQPTLSEISPGVLRVDGNTAAYVLRDGKRGIVIGSPAGLTIESLKRRGIEACDLILLTHHHRDSSAGVEAWLARGTKVRAPKRSLPWLTPDGVKEFWDKSLPPVLPGQFPPLQHRQWAVWSYLVLPRGIGGIACDLEDDQELTFTQWKLHVVATPGHSPDHAAYLAEPIPVDGWRIVFCGDAFCEPGKMWTPYSLEWHHVNTDGVVAAAQSIRRLAALKPTMLCPEHALPLGDEIQPPLDKTLFNFDWPLTTTWRTTEIQPALEETATNLQRVATLKSFEQFRQQTAPDAPLPKFLAPEQVGSATPEGNTKPWTRLSPHLFLSGNTYALASRDGPVLLVDPYDRGLNTRLAELKRDYAFGPAEVAFITHAHNDHYTGLFALPPQPPVKVWVTDEIADVISAPDRYRAPYVDPRPVHVDRRFKSGQFATWREYSFRIFRQPGQTRFAMAIDTEVDGRRVLFTGDNFYRADQYTGSGGWSGLNRGLPGGYAQSISRVMELKPDWLLTEHGGAMLYDEQDFVLRSRWAQAAEEVADALCPSGRDSLDWDPHIVRFDPVRVHTRAGATAHIELVAGPLDNVPRGQVQLYRDEPGLAGLKLAPAEMTIHLDAARSDAAEVRQAVAVEVPHDFKPGRRIISFHGEFSGRALPADVFVVLEVDPPGNER